MEDLISRRSRDENALNRNYTTRGINLASNNNFTNVQSRDITWGLLPCSEHFRKCRSRDRHVLKCAPDERRTNQIRCEMRRIWINRQMANRAAITTNYGMCLRYLGETRGFAIIVRLTMTLPLVTVAARAIKHRVQQGPPSFSPGALGRFISMPANRWRLRYPVGGLPSQS